jgi:hypothetical protein
MASSLDGHENTYTEAWALMNSIKKYTVNSLVNALNNRKRRKLIRIFTTLSAKIHLLPRS